MATLRVFKSSLPSCNFIFGNGKPAIFVQGVYRTDVEWEIGALESEVRAGNPFIYIDPNEKEIDSEMVDPMNALRAKIIAEYVAAHTAITNPENDMGNSSQDPVKPANSMDVAPAAAGGSGAMLANLVARTAGKAGK